MSSRRTVYLIGVLLLAVLFSVPQVLLGLNIAMQIFVKPIWPLPTVTYQQTIMGFFDHRRQLQTLQFWRDKFLHSVDIKDESGEVIARKVILVDPESGEIDEIKSTYPGGKTFQTSICGDELWFTRHIPTNPRINGGQDFMSNDTYELIDRVFQNSNRPALYNYGLEPTNAHQFLWKGQSAFVRQPGTIVGEIPKPFLPIVLLTRQIDQWNPVGELSIPEVDGDWIWEDKPIRLSPDSVKFEETNGRPGVQIFNTGDTIQLFVHTGQRDDSRLFHHEGLKVIPRPETGDQKKPVDQIVEGDNSPAPATAEQTDKDHGNWSLVRAKPTVEYLGFGQTNGVLIDGKPAAIIIDNVVKSTGTLTTTAQLYRLEGKTWNEYASIPLPTGAMTFATFTTRDGQRSYLVSRSFLGESHVYALETNGFRKTAGSAALKTYGYERRLTIYETLIKTYSAILGILTVSGFVLAASASLLMQRYTIPDYESGVQTVKLASLFRRGTARFIDLTLVGAVALGVGCWLMRHFDWVSYLEAQNLSLKHPLNQDAAQKVMILAVILISVFSAMVVVQAVWSITPGKWLCGLKAVRTTLRPCGFAASLAREIMLFVDCCNFLCWTPGIVSIALTDHRQRLGDHVADTIVIESRSLVEAQKPN